MNSTFQRMPAETDLQDPECPQAVQAAAWASGALDLASQRVYLKHLTHCPYCTAELAAFQKTVAQLRAMRPPGAEPSADLTRRIMSALPPDAFRITPFTRMLSFVRRNRSLAAAAAAAAVLVASLGAWQASLHQAVDTHPAAIAGCSWIARQQEADGSWDPARNGGAAIYRPALTALASLALMRESGRYSREIRTACAALQQSQGADGAFGPDHSGRMYNQALATWALLAAYGNGHPPELKGALDRSLAFIRARQQPSGGWGYFASADDPANTAVTAWQIQVLARARQAGWDDAGGHLRKGLNWLRQRTDASGQFGYTATRGDASTTPTLNAMGAYTLLTAGGSRPELILTAATTLNRMRLEPLADDAQDSDLYRAFFTAAAWDASGDGKRANRVRADVCSRRETRGANKGSWTPADNWSKVGGRLYATSLAVLTLQPRAGVAGGG